MGRLFLDNAGKVSVIRGAGLPALVSVRGFRPQSAMVNSIGTGSQVNLQIQPSLKDSIYIYSFGDNMGSLEVRGTAFVGQFCRGSRRTPGDGVFEVMQYYAQNRASRRLQHVSVSVGKTVFSGFLLSCQIQTQQNNNRFFGWTLSFASLPNFDNLGGGSQRTPFITSGGPSASPAPSAAPASGQRPDSRGVSNLIRRVG